MFPHGINAYKPQMLLEKGSQKARKQSQPECHEAAYLQGPMMQHPEALAKPEPKYFLLCNLLPDAPKAEILQKSSVTGFQ